MKKFKPNKYICYLYMLIPLIRNAVANYSSNEDIWYIMRYGKLILEKGFIHTDMLSIHSGLHIVIQQPFSCILFHLIYQYLGDYGFFLLCEVLIALYLFIIYKICMLLSNRKTLLSVLISTITCCLLFISFISPRAQIFTYLNLLLILYIMEVFYKNNKTRLIYFLPLISLVQINMHGALWYFQFLFILPYIVQMIFQKNKHVFKILILFVAMFVVGFINPYTYENVLFPFTSYDSYINDFIVELSPINIVSKIHAISYSSIFFFIMLAIVLLIYIYHKKGKLELRHLLLFGGTTILTLVNIRSMAMFILGTIPFLANYLKDMKWETKEEYIDTKKVWVVLCSLILIGAAFYPNRLKSNVDKGGNYLNNNYDKNIVLYTNFNYGSYVEYLGFHSYMDTRAEVFLKKENKKADIFKEGMQIEYYCTDYKEFIKKYKFTHMLVEKDNCLYKILKKNKTKIVFKDKKYVIFEL